MAINFGLLNTNAPAEIGATFGNALAMRRKQDKQDEDRAFQREGQQMQNALARMQMTKAQADMDEEAAFKTASGNLPSGASSVSPEMLQASPKLAFQHQKVLTDQQKALVEMRAKMTDLQGKKIELYRSQLPAVETPEQMAQWYVTQRQDPDLQGFAWPTTLDETLNTLRTASQSPQGFGQYKLKVAQGISGFLEANKQPEATPFMRELEARGVKPGTAEWNAALAQKHSKDTTHGPGTTVSINTGQKGLDNELKLRGDFRGEPVYKAHQEMSSAHSQIKQALAQQSPAGDLAGATKIMKLLDPGSVVRESELGMAMAASGLLDRVQNYATNVLNGTKLTPTQRADFQRLADALYSESVKAYNAKGDEYRGIAKEYGLNEGRVAGATASAPPAAQEKTTNAKGWELHKDAKGNRAYVSPDGKQFEEVR